MQIQMNGFHRLLANSRPKVDKSAWQARRQMLSDEISIKRTSPVETTISPEARDMWKKMQEDSQKQDTQQPQTEQQEWDTEQTQRNEEYDELTRLVRIWGKYIDDANNSFERQEHWKQTLEKKQAALQELTRMKALEQSEERRREQEAQKSSEQSSIHQEEVNKKNSELLMMLESFDKIEEDDKEEKKDKDEDESAQKKEEALNRQEQNGITQTGEWMGVSTAKKEMHLNDTIDEICQYGLNRLARTREIRAKFLAEARDTAQTMASDEYTSREKNMVAFEFNINADSVYMETYYERRWGLQEVVNANDLRREHIGIQHLEAARKQQEAKQAAAAENTINQNWQEMYSSYGRQLAKIVQEKIDEKNDITNPERKEEPEKEEENDKNIIDTAGNDSKENTEDEQI